MTSTAKFDPHPPASLPRYYYDFKNLINLTLYGSSDIIMDYHPNAEQISTSPVYFWRDDRLYSGSIWECEDCGSLGFCIEREFWISPVAIVAELLRCL